MSSKPLHYCPTQVYTILWAGTENEMGSITHPPLCGQVGKTGRVIGYSNLNRTQSLLRFEKSANPCIKCMNRLTKVE